VNIAVADLRIVNGTVLTMAPGWELIADGVVCSREGLISYVGPADQAPKPGDEQVIDASGCAVLPGLVNAHTHLAMTLFRGYADDMMLQEWLEDWIWPAEMRLRPEDVYWGSLLGACEMLHFGVTCFNDMYHMPEQTVAAALDSGIRACPSGVLLGFLPDAEQLLEEAIAFVRHLQQQNHPRIHPMLAPHALYTCPDEMLLKVGEGARDTGVPLHIHLAETASEVQDSYDEYGESPVAHLNTLGLLDIPMLAAHCVHLSETDIALLAEKQVGIAHCPTSNMKLSSGFAPVPELLEAGAVVGLGTDGCASNNNLDMLEEAHLAALLHKVHSGDPTTIPAHTALVMATRRSAQALGLGDIIGTLEVGKRADIILVDMSSPHLQPHRDPISHLIYAAHGSDVRTTIVEGQIVMNEGEILTVDEGEVIAHATECAAHITGTAG